MKKWLIVAVVVIGVVAVSFSYTRPDTPQQFLSTLSSFGAPNIALLDQATTITRERGAKFAVALTYEAMNEKLISPDECHLTLHAIGHEAYRVYRNDFTPIVDAIQGGYCLDGFVHGVAAEILTSGDPRNTLWKWCAAEATVKRGDGSCYHGAGHAALQDKRDITEALVMCDRLAGGPETDMNQCYRGVFSEVDLEMTNATSGAAVKFGISRKDPFKYCDGINNIYREGCYSQLAQLYRTGKGVAADVAACKAHSRTQSVYAICADIFIALEGRRDFNAGTLGNIPEFLNTLPPWLVKFSLQGLNGEFRDAKQFNALSWSDFCSRLDEAHRETCARPAQIPRDTH